MDYIKKLQLAQKRRLKVLKLDKTGKTQSEIATLMGISPQRVSQILLKAKCRA